MQLPQNYWYPVLESREVRAKPVGVVRLGERLVFWRDAAGFLHANADRCPHLGASLSQGSVTGGHLTCAFHGFAFDGEGQCRHIPANGANGKIPKGMAVQAYRVREEHGFVWLWWGERRTSYPPVPFFEELKEGWRSTTLSVDWPVHYTRAIENQLDVAHLPFVHRTTIGRGGRSFVEGPYVEADTQAIRIWVTTSRDTGRAPRPMAELAAAAVGRDPDLTFLFPGVWRLNVPSGMKNVLAFVPIDVNTTRYYLRSYHRIRNPLLAWPVEAVLRLSTRTILNQDRAIVVTQTPANSMDAEDDRLIGADRAISQFRRLHAQLLNGATEGAEPPTLRLAH
jgi:phenylpropionate dioxygenase-like ring-hydroxylating dioxygenase large terminal subunit